jgi:beta-lactamase regulating signal transducer with metallopeptidase domain
VNQIVALMVAASVRTTVLLFVAAGIALLLRNRAAAVRHALWTAALGVSLSLPLLGAVLPILGVRSPFSIGMFASAAWDRIVVSTFQPDVTRENETSVTSEKSAYQSRSLFDVGEMFSSAPSDASTARQIREALLLVWIAGVLLGLVRILRAGTAVIRLRRSATPVSDIRVVSVWKQLERGLASRNVLVVEADSVSAPGTAGIIRPTIFLPRRAAEWGDLRIRATLAHEIAHVTRRDCLAKMLADVGVALYWFHPLVWYARRSLITESERVCDDLVLSSGVRPERYASVLVETLRASLQKKREPAGILSMARRSELETRLVSILDPNRARGRMSLRATLTATSGAIVAAVLVSAPHLDAAPSNPQRGTRKTVAEPVAEVRSLPAPAKPEKLLAAMRADPLAKLHTLRSPGGEPDRRGDSIAGPLSERLPLSTDIMSTARSTAALSGPDSVFASKLYARLSRTPTWEGDLVSDRSAWALSRQRNGLLVDPLIEALTDPDWRVRAYAAWALTASGASQAVPPLVRVLSDPNWRVRAMAAYAIDGIGDESAAEAMAGMAQDEAWQVRSVAVHFIGRLHRAKYQPLLETALADRHIVVRQAAAEAISEAFSHE